MTVPSSTAVSHGFAQAFYAETACSCAGTPPRTFEQKLSRFIHNVHQPVGQEADELLGSVQIERESLGHGAKYGVRGIKYQLAARMHL
jgi:hypothetical protein